MPDDRSGNVPVETHIPDLNLETTTASIANALSHSLQVGLREFRTVLSTMQVSASTMLLPGMEFSDSKAEPAAAKPATPEQLARAGEPFAKYAVGDYRLNLNGQSMPLDKATVKLGRETGNDLQFASDQVSRKHAEIEFKANGPVIRDLGSSNGTFVNGQRLKPGEETPIKPGDKIKLGSTEVTFGVKPEFHLDLNGRAIDLGKGESYIGRNPENDLVLTDSAISRRHAKITNGEHGPTITDLGSTYGTFVNGKRLKANEAVLLSPGDSIRFGKDEHEYKLGKGSDAAAELPAARPGEVRKRHEVKEYKVGTGEKDPAADPASVQQSNKYKEQGDVRQPLRDGFQTLSGDARIGADGKWNDPNRPGVVVDRTRDQVLNETIAEAHRRFDHLKGDKAALAAELTKFSKEKMHPKGWTEDMVDASYSSFRDENRGKRVLLGDYIERAGNKEGAGVCQHQALLMKVLGDDFGLDVSLVHGYYGIKPPNGLPKDTFANHAWNEVHIDGKTYIYDPRHEKYGKTAAEMPMHNPARSWLAAPEAKPAGRIAALDLKAGDRINHEGEQHWLVTADKPKVPGNVVISQSATRDCAADEIAELNGNRKLVVGEKYKVRRSSGAIEEGWQLLGKTPDGELKFYKADGIKKEVSLKELARENPNMGEIRSAREGEPEAKLAKEVERGLDMAEEMRVKMSGLKLTSKEQVSQLLKSCLEEIDSLPAGKQWSEKERSNFEKFIDAYQKGDVDAVSAAHSRLKVELPAAAAAQPGRSGEEQARALEQTSLKDMQRKLQAPEERAKAVAELIDKGPIRGTLEDAGMPKDKARDLERRLLSDDKLEREKAQKEIDAHFESAGRGGFRGFAKEFKGRAGALVIVAAAILPLIFAYNSADDKDLAPSTWSGGKR